MRPEVAHGRGEVNDLGGARSSQLERATGSVLSLELELELGSRRIKHCEQQKGEGQIQSGRQLSSKEWCCEASDQSMT